MGYFESIEKSLKQAIEIEKKNRRSAHFEKLVSDKDICLSKESDLDAKMNYYSTLEDGVVIAVSDIICQDGIHEYQKIVFKIENKRAVAYLPCRVFRVVVNFSREELLALQCVLLTNAMEMWDLARTKGFID